jgi:MFS family permease
MYSIDWEAIRRPLRKAGGRAASGSGRQAVSPVVWSLGFTSFLTDISSEMVASIIPVYLVLHLRMSPLAFGTIDGIYQGFAALLRLASGFAGDYSGHHKAVAVFGYGLSAFCRIGLLAAGNVWTAIAGIVALDRTGKGIRTAPRDALISLNSPPDALALAFGVHRSLDAAGAMLGPLVAFLLLAWMPLRFDVIFVVSFCVAVVGVSVIALFVPSDKSPEVATRAEKLSLRDAFSVWKGTTFRPVLVTASLLSAATMSDAFVFLSLQSQLEFSAGYFPLLFVGVSLTHFALAAPVGRLADRHGRLRVFLSGHVLLVILYLLLLVPIASPSRVISALFLLGCYYAATDGVLAAIAAGSLRRDLYGSGLALLATGTNLGRLLSSLVFGILWTSIGPLGATVVFAAALGAALLVSIVMLRGHFEHGRPSIA